MKLFSAVVLLLALVAIGCSGDAMVAQDDAADVAAKAPKFVPIEGAMDFTGDLEPVLDCGYGQIFHVRYDGLGDFDHLGRTEIVSMAETCEFIFDPPVLVVFVVTGTATLTGANGDEVFSEWFMLGYPDPAGGPTPFTMEIDVTGGSGRFDGADGFMTGAGQFDRATMLGYESFSGWISSVGSLKQK